MASLALIGVLESQPGKEATRVPSYPRAAVSAVYDPVDLPVPGVGPDAVLPASRPPVRGLPAGARVDALFVGDRGVLSGATPLARGCGEAPHAGDWTTGPRPRDARRLA